MGTSEVSPGQSRAAVSPDKAGARGIEWVPQSLQVTVLSLTEDVRTRQCERGVWGMHGRNQL